MPERQLGRISRLSAASRFRSPCDSVEDESSQNPAVNYLLDTNVISEWVKPKPDPKVVRWLATSDEDSLYLSILSFAEIWHGIERMSAGTRRDALQVWVEQDLVARFESRILAVDFAVAKAWGRLMTRAAKAGTNLGAVDGFFAATAEAHGFALVTRNAKHFDGLGVDLLNPWLS